MMEPDLSSILSSQARFRVLRCLTGVISPVNLRRLEKFTNLPIRSVQLATAGLVAERVLIKRTQGRYKEFSLNPAHPMSRVLRELFTAARNEELRLRAEGYSARASESLRFSDEMSELMKKTKRK